MTYDKTLKVRVSTQDYDMFRAVCDAEGVSVSDMLRQRIQESLLNDSVSDWE